MTLKNINTEKKCCEALKKIDKAIYSCYKCENGSYYQGKNYFKICRKCKSKSSITRNTIFQDVRFGIVKAFAISFLDYTSNYSLKAIDVSIENNISIKTARNFLSKIRSEKDFVSELVNNISKSKDRINTSNLEKLELFIQNNGIDINQLNDLQYNNRTIR